jgi:DnaK suppressor protein
MNLHDIKAQLLTVKAEMEARLLRTHKHIHLKDEAVSPNFHEQVVEREDDEIVHALDMEGRKELEQINRALQRLEAGHYLNCGRCGQPIGEQRLIAVPYTEFCIKCAGA